MVNIKRLVAECLRAAVALAASAGLIAGSAQAETWSLAEAAKPYAGATLHCMGDGYAPALAYQKLSEEFTQITGIKVEWETADLAVMNQKMLADAMNNTGIYDCDEVTSVDVGLWIARDFVKPVQDFLDDPKLRDPDFDPYKQFIPETLAFSSMENGKIYGLPYHFIPRFMVVRKDIHECTSEQAAFKEKYKYDLPLKPETWEQFRDVAEFFTRKAGDNLCDKALTEDFYGTAVSLKRYLATQYDFEMFLNAFGGLMFKGDGRLPSAEGFKSGEDIAFDSPEGIKGLEYWLSLLKFVPPGYLEYTWDNTYSDMCKGKLYTYPTWGDTTPFLEDSSDQGCPAVAGKMAYYPVPGTHQTGAEGQTWFIPASSKNPEAAFLFLQWLASKDVALRCQGMGCTSPQRDPWFDKAYDSEGRAQVTREIIDKGYLIARAHPPGLSKISTILIDNLQAAARGEMTAEQALKDAADKGRKLMSSSQ
ncbi:ABC transporter substrate-binding protein [Aestuariivirga sp.]|uniref:ABC transporter substrate-binding protein n=1 Tax=Aestuariivirga sp. TaxID=2650926 RepID=UPI0039196F1C